jgi:hypothetical protein
MRPYFRTVGELGRLNGYGEKDWVQLLTQQRRMRGVPVRVSWHRERTWYRLFQYCSGFLGASVKKIVGPVLAEQLRRARLRLEAMWVCPPGFYLATRPFLCGIHSTCFYRPLQMNRDMSIVRQTRIQPTLVPASARTELSSQSLL